MRIHVLSDLHLEHTSYCPAAVEADVVVLAGDIHTHGRSVEWARAAYPRSQVLIVPGNHDSWDSSVEEAVKTLKSKACRRVRVLEQNAVVINNVRFLGATAWSDFRSTGNEMLAMMAAQRTLKDFAHIHHWTAQAAQVAARRARSWLRDELETPFAGKTVVITHHAPSTRSTEETARGSHLDASFANSWEDLFGSEVTLWIHGHTHQFVDYELLGTRVCSNPRGYPGQQTGFNPSYIVDL